MAPPSLPIPVAGADITGEWLAAVLGTPGDAAVEVERFADEYGFASEIYRVSWQAGGTERSVVVKLWATDRPAGDREASFYRVVAPTLPVRLPGCHYAASAAGRAVLVLEDLAPSRQGDVLQPVDGVVACRLVTDVAAVHAATAGSPVLGAPWLAPRRPQLRPGEWFATRLEDFYARFGPAPDRLLRRLLDRLPAAQDVAAGVLAPAPDVLLHGDLHLDNVVFVGSDPVVLDWANCGPGPAALDVVDVAFGAGPLDGFHDTLARYRTALGDRMAGVVGGVPFDDQIGAALLVKFAIWTLGVARFHPPVRADMVEAGVARAYAALRSWHAYSPALVDSVV